MFYSESLLSKSGPLARVWLSANIERKLSKSHVLQSDIKSSVHAIVDQGTAPMALRLSGQLLLGVVRIYSRKARYLLDDCNEALLKLKMAFNTGNVDLPSALSAQTPKNLTLEDCISDFVIPELDPVLLDYSPKSSKVSTMDENPLSWETQHNYHPELGRRNPEENNREDFDEEDMHMDLDLGLESAIFADKLAEEDSILPIEAVAEEQLTPVQADHFDPAGHIQADLSLEVSKEMENAISPETLAAVSDHFHILSPENDITRQNPNSGRSASPLHSGVDNLGISNHAHTVNRDLVSPKHNACGPKRRKTVPKDSNTVIVSQKLIEHQRNPAAILVQPQDTKNISHRHAKLRAFFVRDLMNHELDYRLAPDLHNLVSLDAVIQTRINKRKRDSGVGDLSEADDHKNDSDSDTQHKLVHLQIPEDETLGNVADCSSFAILEEPTYQGDQFVEQQDQDHKQAADGPQSEHKEIAVIPEEPMFSKDQLHQIPRDSASLNQRFIMQSLRHQASPSILQDMLPAIDTTKMDITNAFFDVLALASKDVLAVAQDPENFGGAIAVSLKY